MAGLTAEYSSEMIHDCSKQVKGVQTSLSINEKG